MDGKNTDPRVATLLGFFPPSYCAFEIIVVLRTFFFLCFNVINAYSLCFVVDDTKAKVFTGKKITENQLKITNVIQEIYNMQSRITDPSQKLDLNQEM